MKRSCRNGCMLASIRAVAQQRRHKPLQWQNVNESKTFPLS
jgi:hypothetical protein